MTSRSWAHLYYTSRLLDINCGQFNEAKRFTANLMNSQSCLYTLVYKGYNFFSCSPSKLSNSETLENGNKTPSEYYEPAYLTASEFSKFFDYNPADLFDFKTRLSSYKDFNQSNSFNESKNPLLFLLGSTTTENFYETKSSFNLKNSTELNMSKESNSKAENNFEATNSLSNNHFTPPNIPASGLQIIEGPNDKNHTMESVYPDQSVSNELFFFSIDISNMAEAPICEGYIFKNFLQVPTHCMSELNGTLFMKARGISHYHRNRLYCGKCGHLMRSKEFGAFRVCTNPDCKFWEYPRIDPAVIMLIHKGEYCLLGHKSIRRLNFYSCLAGFSSMSESLEQTVERETYEETGVKVNIDTVRYFGSQPWLFPQSLMLGFDGEAIHVPPQPLTDLEKDALEFSPMTSHGGTIKDSQGNIIYLPKIQLLDGELEDARWFHMSLVKQMVYKTEKKQAEFHLPMPASIAFQLIKNWVDQAPLIKACI